MVLKTSAEGGRSVAGTVAAASGGEGVIVRDQVGDFVVVVVEIDKPGDLIIVECVIKASIPGPMQHIRFIKSG